MPGNLPADMRRALGGKAVARAVPKAAKFSNRAGSKSFDMLSAGYRRGAQRDVWSSIGNIGPGTVMKKILRERGVGSNGRGTGSRSGHAGQGASGCPFDVL
jgi:hypothetical protein